MATRKKADKKPEQCSVSIKLFGKTYTADGETVLEALSKLTPGRAKGRGIVTVKRGDKTKERVLMPALVYRLFNSSGMSRAITLKSVSTLFDI